MDKAGGPQPVDAGAIIWIVVTAVLVLCTLCATTPRPFGVKPPPAQGALKAAQHVQSATPAPLVQSGGAVLPTVTEAAPSRPPFFVRVIANWDMARNYASLSKPDGGHEGLRVLNGIRVIAIGLVVLGHTFAFLRVDNQTYASEIVETRFMTAWIIGIHGDSSARDDAFRFISPWL